MLITDIDTNNTSRERSGKFQASPWTRTRRTETTVPAAKLLAIELEIHRARCRSSAVSAARQVLKNLA